MIIARHVALTLGGKRILDEVSIGVEPGTITAVIGPNGAGKSTLLKIITGELKPDRGMVQLDGRDIENWSAQEMARRRAVLPQSSSLSFPFVVREVVLMGRMPYRDGLETAEDLAIGREALSLVDLEAFEERNYITLSGGERQRVHLARILAQVWETDKENPKYLLLDEPTSSLDLQHQHSTLQIARQWAGRGAGVLVILHDLNLAMTYVDKVLLLDRGKTVAHDEVEKVLTPEILGPVFKVETQVLTIEGQTRPQLVTHPREASAGFNGG